jgi:hypothetical protein
MPWEISKNSFYVWYIWDNEHVITLTNKWYECHILLEFYHKYYYIDEIGSRIGKRFGPRVQALLSALPTPREYNAWAKRFCDAFSEDYAEKAAVLHTLPQPIAEAIEEYLM